MTKEKLYRIHDAFPPMTKYQWLVMANRLWEELYLMRLKGMEKNYMYKDTAKVLLKIYKKFKVKTI